MKKLSILIIAIITWLLATYILNILNIHGIARYIILLLVGMLLGVYEDLHTHKS